MEHFKNPYQKFDCKALSETRWESRIDALEPLRYHIDEVYDAVYEATTDAKLTLMEKVVIGIANKLTDFRFLCCLTTWYDVLFKINCVSKTLGKKVVNLQSALKLIEGVKAFLGSMRKENGLISVITDEVLVRPRKMKRQFSYKGKDW